MINSTAFRPPVERKYELKHQSDHPTRGPVYKIVQKTQKGELYEVPDADNTESSVFFLETKTKAQIPALFIENKNCKSNMVILYSHGNSTDLGRMFKPLQDLSLALNIHVLAYEYNGYGPTKGPVGEMELVFGIIAAYEFLTQKLAFKWSQIVLYGRSIGSGPTVYLSSHPDYPVSGIILHSPIASGFRIFDFDFQKTDSSDLFPNCDFIEHVKSHVFLMHGDSDVDVTIAHGKLLASKCRNPYNPWWVPDGDHNNIDYKFRKAYYLRIGKFLRYVRDFNLDKSEQELLEFYKVTPWSAKLDHIYFKRIQKVEADHKKYLDKQAKKKSKKLKKQSTDIKVLSDDSKIRSRSLSQKFIESQDSVRERGRSIMVENREGDEPEFRVVEIQSSYNRPKLFAKASRASSVRSRTPMNREKEIEISSCSVSSTRAKELDEVNDDEFIENSDVKIRRSRTEKVQSKNMLTEVEEDVVDHLKNSNELRNLV